MSDPKRELSRNENRLLARLPAEEMEQLRPHLEEVWMEQGERLIEPDQPIQYIYFPTGMLGSLVTILEDGATVESGSVGREGMIGIPILLDMPTTPMETLAQIPGYALRIKSKIFKEIFDKGGKLHSLSHRYIHTLFVVASQSAACNRRHQIRQRLCRWLLMSSDGVGSNQINLTQEYLAAMLGVRRSGVTEAALELQGKGLIRYHRGRVEILERKKLEAMACECYYLVKNEFDRLLA
ncbi:MAG TPA: Crp/Fnr family transcriptional regulator [Blastocatellia bacterium]|nr:Crp/Fnr family transcriptional regulator [Blastocatellia bacterium]